MLDWICLTLDAIHARLVKPRVERIRDADLRRQRALLVEVARRGRVDRMV